MTSSGQLIPLGELGRFTLAAEDPIVYHKDLRPVEYVTAEMEGKLGAPIYGMHTIEDHLKNYITPDGQHISGLTLGGTIGRYGAPDDDNKSGFEWSGEWTVTYETFRDMGAAFMAALVLIYALIVWEFKNFTLAGLIMAPIPLTLIGIVPGHLIIGAEFTATSMIGFIALAGIIVRNSILLVEFVKQEVSDGKDIVDAVISAGQIRMRPILITAGTLMVGAAMLFSDPIFIGMAASLFFGTLVATVLTLVVIPLGCITVKKQFYVLAGIDTPVTTDECEIQDTSSRLPLWLIVWSKLVTAVTWLFYIFRAIYFMAQMAFNSFIKRFKRDDKPPEPDNSGPGNTPPSSTPPTGGTSGAEATQPTAVEDTASSQHRDAKAPSQADSGSENAGTEKPEKSASKKSRTKSTQTKAENASTDSTTIKSGKKATGKKRRGIRLKDI